MSENKRREVKDLSGKSLDEGRPKVKLVGKPKVIAPGVIGTVYHEEPVEAKPIITGIKAPVREIEPEIKAVPTKAGLKEHRSVDPSMWGKFNQPGPQVIHANRPRQRTVPAVSGRPMPTRGEVVSEGTLLRRLLGRVLGDKT